ncbi:MAG: Peroxiredoxin [uncultured Aureispira sp.]|uniref:Peroxiredoxin n=1 Tax=uncultured Aureispira sp. TaxID=1331704 RepID=A0A6S6UKU5_9BACT|nr:MAG: Peroxiredoxin [uncultured Aureispira sp.]
MKKTLLLCLASYFLCIGTSLGQYKITVTIDGYEKDTCILGYQIGKTTYIAQQVNTKNKNGDFIFEGEEALMGGLYSVLIKPNNVFFQFILSNDEEQKDLKIKTKIIDNPARDLTSNLKIKNSPDNAIFEDYKAFLTSMRMRSETYNTALAAAKEQKDDAKIAELTQKIQGLDGEVTKYQDDLLKNNPKLLAPKLITGSRQPEVPKELVDRADILRYYKAHFWDHYDWTDERLIRTPILKEKIETYIERLTLQQVDSVSKACEYIIDQALASKNKEVFQFAAVYLLNKYAEQDVICLDGVYVSIAQKYYCSGMAYWLDSAQVEGICADAAKMAPLRCGRSAPEIRLKNINDSSYVSLYNIRKPFVAVYFWDPSCGNCAKMTDKLIPVYEKYKDRGFEVLGVCSKSWKDVDACRTKIEKQKMDWINLSDAPYPLAWVKKYYDLRSNPFIYLLDEDKNILFKRITAEQLDQILEREFDRYEKEQKTKKK